LWLFHIVTGVFSRQPPLDLQPKRKGCFLLDVVTC
jgi:hypothetical protein